MSGLGLDYIISHTGIWINLYVILALIALILVIVYFIFRHRRYKKTEKELEDLLEEKYEKEGAGEIKTEPDDSAIATATSAASVASTTSSDDIDSRYPEYK